MPQKTYHKAFTLIELLTVTAIILIIAGAIIINLNIARKKSRDAARKSDLKQIQTALESYATDHGQYGTLSGNSATSTGDAGWISLQSQLSSYIPQLPKDPRNATAAPAKDCRKFAASGNSTFCYEFQMAQDSYYFAAVLETSSGNGSQFSSGNIGPLGNSTFFITGMNPSYIYILESHPGS